MEGSQTKDAAEANNGKGFRKTWLLEGTPSPTLEPSSIFEGRQELPGMVLTVAPN